MLGGLKFIPREEVERASAENESSRSRSKKRKEKDRGKDKIKRSGKKKRWNSESDQSSDFSDDSGAKDESAQDLREDAKTKRKEAGMEWMLKAPERPFGGSTAPEVQERPSLDSEKPEIHSRELNPYLASGAEESGQPDIQKSSLPVIGDGGASWRLKALKRAQEQAAREGRKLDEVVEERWGSLASLASSVTTKRSAHANAHLHAIRNRRSQNDSEGSEGGAKSREVLERRGYKGGDHGWRGDIDRERSRMRVPQLDGGLSWKNRRKSENQPLREADIAIIRSAAQTMNKYDNDGSFLKNFRPIELSLAEPDEGKDDGPSTDAVSQTARASRPMGEAFDYISSDSEDVPQKEKMDTPQRDSVAGGSSTGRTANHVSAQVVGPAQRSVAGGSSAGLSANQVAAKAIRLRLMGKGKEADELLKDLEDRLKDEEVHRSSARDFSARPTESERPRSVPSGGLNLSTTLAHDKVRSHRQSYDGELAGSIVRNKQYKGDVDDEYEYGDGLETASSRGKKGNKNALGEHGSRSRGGGFNRITTQQERCQFCFENPERPKHLVIAIANFTYLMIPPRSSLVPFHCYIVPMQHEGATRNVDEGIWQELRNFKKCIVQMFADQGKEVLFLETAMGFSRQRRHCYIECIPVPLDAAKDAPLYFKKAIDECEDEWSQHNAKKLIDTRQKGLRNSIPKNFPYFHVEFGMKGGYCHVIDDESSFKHQFGLDVVAGILELPEEDTYGNHRQEKVDQQKKKVKDFLKLWEPFDWTKMLD